MIKPISEYLLLSIVFAAIAVASSIPAYSDDQTHVQLLTNDEAKELKFSDSEWDKEPPIAHEDSQDPAPGILIKDPELIDETKGPTIIMITPANVLVLFEENDSKLDLDTLEVWAEKYFLKKNITSRVRKYITTDENGARLKVDSVKVPSGKYKVGIKIADVDGRETIRKYRLKVK